MKKAFDQTVSDRSSIICKRGVNKKVLKVPSVEQKVLDATSNEPWGPHGSLLADIAQASRNSFGDPYSLDGDRYGRCYDDRSRDGNRDDDHRGRSRSIDNYSNGSRSRSSDRNGDHAYDDDDQYSSSFHLFINILTFFTSIALLLIFSVIYYLLPTVEAVQGLRIALKMEGDIIESF
ncbi:hypothetical protein T459_07255 [Capsicum annuum]|uniref:ENTH domain-containing protein n=1 Tax=Capsicum annuum TaxID=4072 RepID=A0A2G2ZT47_CAPAN|nr:hypothetical protein T459_07255 [Capsicum annuum]